MKSSNIELLLHAGSRARFEDVSRNLADRAELLARDNTKADVLRLVNDWLCDDRNE